MSDFTQRARLLVCAGLWLAAEASAAHAGLLDSWLARKPPTPNSRAQSPAAAEETGFCSDCDRNHNPRHIERCRNHCGQTYYPAIPPYCAPCYGVYPTCWRRLEECWSCPQERYSTKPKRRSEMDPLRDTQGVPPLPAAGAPYVPSEPAAKSAEDAAPPAVKSPAAPAETEADAPAIPEVEPPASEPGPQSRARSERVLPASAQQPAVKSAAPARSKSVEQLIRELR